VLCPYLLCSKKRYAGLYWTRPDKWDKLDAKGMEVVRRDNCKLVRSVLDTCLRKLMIDKDVDGAVNHVKRTISDLLRNKVDMSLLVRAAAIALRAHLLPLNPACSVGLIGKGFKGAAHPLRPFRW
jgi:DNA polymerase delta subunit 1